MTLVVTGHGGATDSFVASSTAVPGVSTITGTKELTWANSASAGAKSPTASPATAVGTTPTNLVNHIFPTFLVVVVEVLVIGPLRI